MHQTDKMRELFRRYGEDRTRVVQAYALAEERGEVTRKSNVRRLTALDYASRLFADGVRRGWIRE